MPTSTDFLVQNQVVIGLWIQALVAIGTVAVAIMAIYGDAIKEFIFRPKIRIETGSQTPFVEKIALTSAGQASGEIVKIRIKIINYGGSIGRSCVALIEKIFKKRTDNQTFHTIKSIAPANLLWLSGNPKYDLRSSMPSYVEIARIEKVEVASENPSSDITARPTTPQFELFVSVQEAGQRGVYVKLGKGTFAIPVVVNPENSSRPLSVFIEIFWDGSRIADYLDESHFYIKLLEKPPEEILN